MGDGRDVPVGDEAVRRSGGSRVGVERLDRRFQGGRARERTTGRRGWLHHKRPGPLVTVCQREALSKARRRPLHPIIPTVPVRVSHVQGAHCAERHSQWLARGVWRAAAERRVIGAAEAPANFA
eukprot:scaffold26788_cov58-Phaeocystis_antarctica.AAC.3